ncbi:succinylglutamate desuccinylase [Marinobacter sp. M1N3S26]|uniref:succinylglutamate desuccinylase n=1 Tax=Marinobacter sp. M1N3S26 TaxID=3382299 RepID=UPI00387AAEB8
MDRGVLFDGQPDWLAHTLATADQSCAEASTTLPGGRLIRPGTGLLQFEPSQPLNGAPALLLSAGVHGNETAPIELLNRLVDNITNGVVRPRIPLLFMLGNPPAMVAAQRFVEHNLNRLFRGAWKGYPDGGETRRAAQLETTCQAFRDRHPGPLRHYDLHTAIRPSRREKFALYPFVEGRQVPDDELDFLAAADIGTLLLQHQPATTFSAFSAETLGAESFTLELGKVHPFGHNDLGRLTALNKALMALMEQRSLPDLDHRRSPAVFRVVHEILNTGEHFRFHIADDVANFTEYPTGTVIWEDDTTEYRVGPEPEAIIFPNPKVPVGHRVGLMVRQCSGE